MIVVDASALLAILLDEPEADAFRRVLEANPSLISPVNYWEVLARAHKEAKEPGANRALNIVSALGVQVAEVGALDAHLAYGAFARFGKGVGGPLNLGDCFAYALAEREGDGLLFKGDDFPKTDAKPAI
ncbi:type II toxin-antitoxin system VapC family toxin [Phenylobacterium sp.]|uniref:type II toxin-antitoxin system VapC family toxin n=1 Tax=Phenylobacterium sp. TaxID=1871053 RepID=UPI00301C8C82